ncbi:hypothetical protein LEN26_019963 [Aphanomyces euteiches]|nr:hypothetical protein LEN26_019963 [Aphanomyces euteiches]KAH9112554.1 hypothetical protein AeMF1_013139 [Aphanomyces euteiches]KAH9183086.1 hypothetical protein AeNC1_014936 [Aphanomyces euteiches]
MTELRKIVLINIGSRGDIQPYCLLGQALAARGHDVTIAAEKRAEDMVVNEYKLPYRCIAGDFAGILFDMEYRERLRHARNFEFLKMTGDWCKRFDKSELQASVVAALEGAQLVISGHIVSFYSYCVAEAMGATWVPLYLGNHPMPTNEFPHWIVENLTFGFSCLNKWTHNKIHESIWSENRDEINRWRQETLKLPPISSKFGILDAMLANDAITVMDAYSLVLSGPKQRIPIDYPPGKNACVGFIFPSEQVPGPLALQTFLKESNLPVIYLGFGSMPTLEPLALVQLALQVCHDVKCRCVLAIGWSCENLTESLALAARHPNTIYVETEIVSHMWLFPRMSCILHHCGLGTVGAALRSGVPQLPCPKFIDQPHNAKLLVKLGVALECIKMTAREVSLAVQRVLRNERNVQDRAREIATVVARESDNNVARICDLILAAPPTFN